MTLKKVVTWVVVAVAVYYVLNSPGESAQFVRGAGRALGDAAASFASFVGSLL